MPSESAFTIEDWPQPGTGHRGPVLRYGRGPTLLAYDTDNDRIAVVTIPLCLQIICGHPNDEVLSGHPLYGKGLDFYAVHRVRHSARLDALERANSVHDRHDASGYLADKEHWVFTFQDETVEALVVASAGYAPYFRLVDAWADAESLLAIADAD